MPRSRRRRSTPPSMGRACWRAIRRTIRGRSRDSAVETDFGTVVRSVLCGPDNREDNDDHQQAGAKHIDRGWAFASLGVPRHG